jgi:predicted transcriptional regulator
MRRMGGPIIFCDADNVIARLRRKLGISQGKLSRILGVTDSSICCWETEKVKIPGPVDGLCRILLKHPEMVGFIYREPKIRSLRAKTV